MFCHVCALKMLFCFDMLLAGPEQPGNRQPGLVSARMECQWVHTEHATKSTKPARSQTLDSRLQSQTPSSVLSCTCRSIYLTNAPGVCPARLGPARSLGHGLLFKLLYYLWLAELGNPASRLSSSPACYGLTLIEFVWRRCFLACWLAGRDISGLWSLVVGSDCSGCPFMACFVVS